MHPRTGKGKLEISGETQHFVLQEKA